MRAARKHDRIHIAPHACISTLHVRANYPMPLKLCYCAKALFDSQAQQVCRGFQFAGTSLLMNFSTESTLVW
jgi:hypothetical protein